MKRLVCETCGSGELIKENEIYRCRACGARYFIETKLVPSAETKVTGTIRVDDSVALTNLYQLARRARDEDNSENATKYYEMILLKDPFSWEAAFYGVYFKAMGCKIAQISTMAENLGNCQRNVLNLILEYVADNEQTEAIQQVVEKSRDAAMLLASAARKFYNDVDSDIRTKYYAEYELNATQAKNIMDTCAVQIEEIFGKDKEKRAWAGEAWKAAADIYCDFLSASIKGLDEYENKIEKYDMEYVDRKLHAKKLKIEEFLADHLAKDIDELRKKIDETPVGYQWGTGPIIFIIFGMWLIAISIGVSSYGEHMIWAYVVGGLAILIGFAAGFPNKEVDKENREIVATATEELKKKQNELEERRKAIETLRNNKF